MLSHAENERLCRIEGDAPMGRLIRRYWIPACLSAELAPAGPPVRLRLLGDDFVAVRDAAGTVRIGARHVNEAGDIVWTYLGPGDPPRFPAYDWTALPAEQRVVVRAPEHANFAQAIEGSIDSAHSWFLHRGAVRDWRLRSTISSDQAPRIEAEDTVYGFRYGALRKVDANPDECYVRTTLFAMPFTSFIPRPINLALPGHVQIFVPVDDEHTMFYGVWFSQNGAALDVDVTLAEVGLRPGIELEPVTYARHQNLENWWRQDRAAMRTGESYTGVSGVLQQDMAVQESMGPIVDRTREHLGTSDVAVIRMRRRMFDALDLFEADGVVAGQDPSIRFELIRSEQKVIPAGEPWQSVGAYAGEFA